MADVEFHTLNVTSWEERQNGSLGLPYNSHYEKLQTFVRSYVSPGLCLFGIIGNIINLIVLTRVRFYKTESRNERGANTGLVCLAISDMLFCISVFPTAFTDHGQVVFPDKSFLLYYQVYGTGVVTTFILTSTWITVTLAVLRYVTISHPMATIAICNPCSVKIIYFCVCLVAVIINSPKYLQYQISDIGYTDNRSLYFIDIGIMDGQNRLSQAFQGIHFTIFIALPALILVFCNCSLVWALHLSIKVRKQYHVPRQSHRRQNRITLLLIIIAVTFIVLVFPSELMDFFMDYVKLDQTKTEIFLAIRVLTNALQMINFSCNFLLYCALNVHFRTVLKDMILCNGRGNTSPRSNDPESRRISKNFKTRNSADSRQSWGRHSSQQEEQDGRLILFSKKIRSNKDSQEHHSSGCCCKEERHSGERHTRLGLCIKEGRGCIERHDSIGFCIKEGRNTEERHERRNRLSSREAQHSNVCHNNIHVMAYGNRDGRSNGDRVKKYAMIQKYEEIS